MNYYPFHIGDYLSATRHLSWEEDAAYRRMLDTYYTTEKPLPLDVRAVCRLVLATTDSQREAVEVVLGEFFERTDAGWVNHRADGEILAMQEKQQKQRDKANKRWQKPDAETGTASAMPRHNQNYAAAQVCDAAAMPPTPTPTPTPTPVNTPSNEGVARTLQGEACMAMKSVGMAGVNPSNPKLTALLEAGITVAELVAAAADAVAKGKPFAYALASAEGRRRDAATAPLPSVQPDAPVETYAQRAARQRMEEVAPMAARKAPGAAFDAAQRFMHGGDVVDVTPTQKQLQGA